MQAQGISKDQRQAILDITGKYGVTDVRLFGSRARGDARPDSDWDLLVKAPEDQKFSLLDLAGLKRELEEELGARVDIMLEGAKVHPIVWGNVQEDSMFL